MHFNTEKENEELQYANSLPTFSGWVKERIREAIVSEKQKKQTTHDTESTTHDLPEGKPKPLHWKI